MTVVSTSPDGPAAPADFSPQALALMVQIRELGRTVNGFGFAPKGRRRSIGTVSSLPEEFLQLVAASLDVNPALGQSYGITALEVREALSFGREFTNAATETRLVAKGMEDTVAERLADVGDKCLRFYYAAKRATPRGAVASSVPHLAEMTRALGMGRKKKKKPAPPPDPLKKGDVK